MEIRIAGVSTNGFSLSYGDTTRCSFEILRRLRKQQRMAIRKRKTRPDTTPPIIGPRLLRSLRTSQVINPDILCTYVLLISDCSRNCRSRSSDKFCIGKQVSRRKKISDCRAHNILLVEMCAPPPTVIVKSALMLELLLLLGSVLALVARVALEVASLQQLVSTPELVVGAIWGISPKTLVRSSEIITISL